MADILTLAFGMTVAMWGAAYVGRLPVVLAPSWLIAVVAMAAPVAGGYLAGKLTGRGTKGGLFSGLLSGILNLLVFGSLISGDQPNVIRPSAALFVPGSIALNGLLGALGAWLGAKRRNVVRPDPDWTASFLHVGLAATFLLLVAGGLVTSNAAGLAVVDWPNSFRYNMFLYPISRMTGGIYYEHAHRLLGSLVGLTTLVIAVHLWRTESRAWVKRLALAAFVLVCIQGILGGLRVTGKFTLSDDPTQTDPNIYLALAHGVLGQVFFSTLAALAVVASRTWREGGDPRPHPPAAIATRAIGLWLPVLLLVQLTLGAAQRHLLFGLWIHVGMAVVVATVAAGAGVRAWLLSDVPVVRRSGQVLLVATALQLALGVGAFIVTGALGTGPIPGAWNVVIRTAHQGTGAALLACAVVYALWTRRFIAGEGVPVAAAVPSR